MDETINSFKTAGVYTSSMWEGIFGARDAKMWQQKCTLVSLLQQRTELNDFKGLCGCKQRDEAISCKFQTSRGAFQ